MVILTKKLDVTALGNDIIDCRIRRAYLPEVEKIVNRAFNVVTTEQGSVEKLEELLDCPVFPDNPNFSKVGINDVIILFRESESECFDFWVIEIVRKSKSRYIF